MKTRMTILGILVGLLMAAGAQAAEVDVGCFVTQPPEGHNPMPHGRNAIGVHIVKTEDGRYVAHLQNVFLAYEQVVQVGDPVRSFPIPNGGICGTYQFYSGDEGGFFFGQDGYLSLTVENQTQQYYARKIENGPVNFCGGLK